MQKTLDEVYTLEEFKEWAENNPEEFNNFAERSHSKMTEIGQKANEFLKAYENTEYKHEIIKAIEFGIDLGQQYYDQELI